MKSRTYRSLSGTFGFVGALALAAAGCTTASPAQPSSAGSGAGTSIIAPIAVAPANASSVAYVSQPVRLTVTNAASTSGAPLTYTFEVAYDAGFSSKIQTKSAVAQGSNGQTTTTLDSLLPGNTYYWHARADGGGTTGVFGTTFQFKLGSPVTLSAPVPVGPANGAYANGTPTLTVTNATKTGNAGPVTYKFEISTNSGFSTIAATQSVSEGAAGQTSYTVSPALAIGSTFFWRATAIDVANAATSPSSTTQFFLTITSVQDLLAFQAGYNQMWGAVVPPGQQGHSALGANWDVGEKISFQGVHYISPQLEALRIFDCIDRGMDPGQAIQWMKDNGYPTIALYYPAPLEVIGINYQYLAGLAANGTPSKNGVWTLVDRGE